MSSDFLFGVSVGVLIMVGAHAISLVWGHTPRRAHTPRLGFPPATVRQIERARRASRADLRPAQLGHGVITARVIEVSAMRSLDDFDREDTAV